MDRNARLELLVLLFVHGCGKTPPTKADARKALFPLLKQQFGDAEARRRIDVAFEVCAGAEELEASGKPKSPRFSLSRSGAQRLEAEFGKLVNAPWPKLRDEYLLPRAAVGSSNAPAGLKSYPALRVYLALRSNGIEYRAGMSATAVLDRIVAKSLAAPRADKTAIKTAVIRSWLGTDTTAADVPADDETVDAGAASKFDLGAFAGHVNEAARQSPTGRWDSNKVFVNHVWRQFQSLGHADGLDADRFKNRLIEANQRGLVGLSRADLVMSMPPDDVRESEIATFGNDVFHFITIQAETS